MKVGRWGFALALAVARSPALSTRGQSPELMDSVRRYQALSGQGNYAAAVPFAKKALRLVEREFGPDHKITANFLGNLAELYRAQGRYGDAEPLYKRSLAIREGALGPEHPDVAQSLNNLALLYQSQGKYAEAEPLYKRSLDIWEKQTAMQMPQP